MLEPIENLISFLKAKSIVKYTAFYLKLIFDALTL